MSEYDNRSAAQFDGERILFWREQYPGVQVIDCRGDRGRPGILSRLFGLDEGDDPKEFVRQDIPYGDRQAVARALVIRSTMEPGGGSYGIAYMGWANCRICGEKLGTRDMFGHGFVWPERAEHYVVRHNVWTPGCDRLLVAIRKAGV